MVHGRGLSFDLMDQAWGSHYSRLTQVEWNKVQLESKETVNLPNNVVSAGTGIIYMFL